MSGKELQGREREEVERKGREGIELGSEGRDGWEQVGEREGNGLGRGVGR